MYQTISGDAVDNYKGAPGAGPVRAKQALAMGRSLSEWWPTVLSIYDKQFKDKRWGLEFVNKTALDEAIMNARCARILRFGDYDFATKQVHLWTPWGTLGKLMIAKQEERT
jgi:DNA polymerase-1